MKFFWPILVAAGLISFRCSSPMHTVTGHLVVQNDSEHKVRGTLEIYENGSGSRCSPYKKTTSVEVNPGASTKGTIKIDCENWTVSHLSVEVFKKESTGRVFTTILNYPSEDTLPASALVQFDGVEPTAIQVSENPYLSMHNGVFDDEPYLKGTIQVRKVEHAGELYIQYTTAEPNEIVAIGLASNEMHSVEVQSMPQTFRTSRVGGHIKKTSEYTEYVVCASDGCRFTR